MIVTVTPNPAVDVTYAVEALALGESHRVGAVTERAGGKGVNVAAVLRALGRHAVVVAPVGADELAAFAGDLTARSVSHSLVETPARTRRSVAVVEPSGRATLLNEAGHEPPRAVWSRVEQAVTALAPQASVVTVSGSLPGETPPDVVRHLVGHARGLGLPVVLDVGGPALAAALEAGPTLVKPNLHEARAALGPHAAPALAAALVAGGAGAAVVTDGAAGLHLRHGHVALHARLKSPLAGNPTGAGDAATAALAAVVERYDGLPGSRDAWVDALRQAVAWSAAAVLSPVAGEVDPRDVDRLLTEVEIEEPAE